MFTRKIQTSRGVRLIFDVGGGSKENMSPPNLTKEQIEARKVRIQIAQDLMNLTGRGIAKIHELENKNYPRSVTDIMLRVTGAADKWTQPFTRGDEGAMKITMGNIAGKKGKNFIDEYNKVEARVANNQAMAAVVRAKNTVVIGGGTGIIQGGKYIGNQIGKMRRGYEDPKPKTDTQESPTLVEMEKKPKIPIEQMEQVAVSLNQKKEETEMAKNEVLDAAQAVSKSATNKSELMKANSQKKELFHQKVGGARTNIEKITKDASSVVKVAADAINNTSNIDQNLKMISGLKGDMLLKNMSEPLSTEIKNFVQSKKTILPNIIFDEEFREKLNTDTLSAEDCLKNQTFLDMFLKDKGDTIASYLPENIREDYQKIRKIQEEMKKVEESRIAVEVSENAVIQAEVDHNDALQRYYSSAEQMKTLADEEGQLQEISNALYDTKDMQSFHEKIPVVINSEDIMSALDTLPSGSSLSLKQWESADGGGSGAILEKMGDDIMVMFPNGDYFKIDSRGEDQKKELEFVKMMSATPVMRRLIGMGTDNFEAFCRQMQIPNPYENPEKQKKFMNMAMYTIGKLVGPDAESMPSDFSSGKPSEVGIREYMTPERIQTFRNALKGNGLMRKEDNSFRPSVLLERSSEIIG